MSKKVASNCWYFAMRTAVTGLTMSLLAGCSSDVTRFSNPFSNPFASSAYAADSAPVSDVAPIKRKLPKQVAVRPVTQQVVSRSLAPPAKATIAKLPHPVSNVAKLARPAIDRTPTASILPRPASSAGGWSLTGGTPIVAATGETAAMLSTRYGVPESALLAANGFNSAGQIQPGTRLIVPVYNAGGAAAAAVAKPAKLAQKIVPPAPIPLAPKAVATAKPKMQFVKGAQPVQQALAKHAVAKPVQVAATAKEKVHVIQATAAPKLPAKPLAAPVTVAKAKPVVAQPVQVAAAQPKPLKTRAVAPVAVPPVVDTTPTASLGPTNATPLQQPAPVAAAVAESNPEFRWPARGRIIQAFKTGGNDGINIAVPEGTSVKAAESGVVAYAGSELKGYGNLVLIRHPNGFVSAYANNAELMVKRGDQVKRGQIVAKSGQTGNVASPQLHFELRKGSTPVDPTNYLAGL